MKSSRNSNGGGSKRVSAFAETVYRVVSKIPRGQARTYGWVAAQVGHPRAARAVGQILKKNPRLVEIPCHRVVRSDGSLGGYVGGPQKKIRLLTIEGFLQPSAPR